MRNISKNLKIIKIKEQKLIHMFVKNLHGRSILKKILPKQNPLTNRIHGT